MKINGVARRYSSGTTDESESEESEMEVDLPTASWSDDDSEAAEEDEEQDLSGEESDELDETDEHLLHSAPASELNRLKKDELIRLYRVGSLPEDPELMTKAEIIRDIITQRQDDAVSLPPSSPPGRSDAASSDYANSSGDEGNVAGGEETDASPSRPLKGRSLSMGNVLVPQPHVPLKRKASLRIQTEGVTRQRTSKESSPSTSANRSSRSTSPPGHRLRSRKVSASTPIDFPVPTPTSTTSKSKSKGKSKHVEFSAEVVDAGPSSRKNSQKERVQAKVIAEESDLTELDSDDEHASSAANPSPRRLRSKDRQRSQDGDTESTPVPKKRSKSSEAQAIGLNVSKLQPLRVVPRRQAKSKITTLRESDVDEGLEEEDQEEELDEDGDHSEGEVPGVDLEEVEMEDAEDEGVVDEDEDEDEEEEVDELVSSASNTPPTSNNHARKTPLRQRLRSRQPVVLEADENEGDDEHEDEEEEEEAPSEAADMQDDEDVETLVTEPRRLRNGKVVGDDDAVMDDEEEGDAVGEEEEEVASEDGAEVEIEGEEIAVDTEDDAEEDPMEDEVDLTVATAKTLVRLRRDDLVRLCETRNLEPVGTKPQLAEALLQWRDRQNNNDSSPSSTGTVRPPSTGKRRRKKQSDRAIPNTPVLLRSNKVHLDEPLTPVPGTSKEKESEELELDLESLGLEDREIPPEKIQKLEKIGSGGFKDVFIGKFKGRRIAISEFRGTLSAMDIKELKLLGGFDHPNIVRFLGVSIPENTRDTPVMIVSELCSNGDLFDYVRNVNPPTLHKVLVMMLDIASGLEYLHMRKPSVIHRDCKSSNILITAKGVAKIADFGLAKVKQSTRSMVKSLVGTVNWQAPELWTAHPKYNHKVDVFSCAMVYWEMLQWHAPSKKYPWEGMNEHAIYEQVGAKKHRPSIAGLKKLWCPEIVELMERMWAQDHIDRPTMSEVVEELQALVKQY
ncbi:TKL/TKL-ccin protein kinase [Coprinopsis sp. MPI-PUGE-AT-0042]|nr:TKL/TKL-ccin protein kinase [Coprinopsis sp. MPI-PUGE-AT-0042]